MASSVTVVPSVGHAILMTQGGIGATPGYDAIDVRRMDSSGLGEGVLSPTAWLVSQRSAGANMTVDVAANVGPALVQGDAVTDQGLYRVQPHSAVINVDIATADGTNPRNDRVVLEIKDNEHDGSGSNLAQVRVITGTPTGGASLSNLTGAPALPNSALHLAYVNVPASDTTISDAQILNGQVSATSNLVYKTLLRESAGFGLDAVAGTYILGTLGATLITPSVSTAAIFSSGLGIGILPSLLYFDDADYALGSVSQKLRVRATVAANATQPLITFTFGLYPVTFAGAADALTMTLGTVVAGSTVAIASPAASTVTPGTSTEFAIPADGAYALGVVTSGTMTNNSIALLTAHLQTRHY